MSEKLEFTGERFTPECEREIWYEHMHRYAFVAPWCDDAKVLDAACGEGYGSEILSRTAAQVTGVDRSEQVIAHARQRYASAGNLVFEEADCTDMPFEDDSFDIVVSFETLEHLKDQERLMCEFRRVLRPDGFLVLSSPDKAEYSERQGFNNEFHERELYREELEALIRQEFPAFSLLGQKLMFHSAIWTLGSIDRAGTRTIKGDGEISAGTIPHAPMYYLAVCAATREHLPDIPVTLDLFDDSGESVYSHYHHEIRKNMSAGGILAERETKIQSLQEQLSRPWWRRLLERD